MNLWIGQEREIIALGLHSFRGTLQVAERWLNRLKVVVRACCRAYFVAHVVRNLAPNFVSGRCSCFCMMLLFRISVQLSAEPLIAFAICNSQHAWAISSIFLHGVFNLIVSTGQFTLNVLYAVKRGQSFEKHFVCFNSSLWAMLWWIIIAKSTILVWNLYFYVTIKHFTFVQRIHT